MKERMLISAKIYSNQRVEKAVAVDSNCTGVEEPCTPGNREDSHALPSQPMLPQSHLLCFHKGEHLEGSTPQGNTALRHV